jgi:carboxymethylenebutenolidase
MGNMVDLVADDGCVLRAYRAAPPGAAKAGVVVMHEAFGMNDHIRDMCERFATDGYLAIAPALYDRVEPGIAIPGYGEADLARALVLRRGMDWDRSVGDMRAAIAMAREAGPVGVVGYCWGGSLAWLAATRCGVDAAVGYYGGQIVQFVDEEPGCPVLLHFAEHDIHVPPESASVVGARHPGIPIHLYDASHGFNCDARDDHHPDAARVAARRTADFLRDSLLPGAGVASGRPSVEGGGGTG